MILLRAWALLIILALSTEAKDLIVVIGGAQRGLSSVKGVAKELESSNFDAIALNFLDKRGIQESTERLIREFKKIPIDRYQRVNLFCFTLGGVVVGNALKQGELKEVSRVVFVESPIENDIAEVAQKVLPKGVVSLFTDKAVREIKDYHFRAVSGVEVALLITTKPNFLAQVVRKSAIKKFPNSPIRVDSLTPTFFFDKYQDFVYLEVDHTTLYKKPKLYASTLQSFFKTGNFGANAKRELENYELPFFPEDVFER